MILTKDRFEEGTSRNGGWSDEQLECFGIGKIKKTGWKKVIIGKDFSQEQIERYLLLKNAHLPPLEVEDEESSILLKWFWALTLYYWFDVT